MTVTIIISIIHYFGSVRTYLYYNIIVYYCLLSDGTRFRRQQLPTTPKLSVERFGPLHR